MTLAILDVLRSTMFLIGIKFRRVAEEGSAMGLGLLLRDGIIQYRFLLGAWLSSAVAYETDRDVVTGRG